MALLDNPEQMAALRADRSLLRPAIQESTRWYPTDPVFLRWVAKDTVLGGVEMKAGSIAYLCVATANRDRSQWADPDRFDIKRPLKRHFAFGAGAHACLGQHLSRQEMEVALNAVLDRLPNLRWDPDKPHPRIVGGTLVARGPDALHVRFDPR
jgi:cytochrome P450